jgi:hypothetical protein
MTKIDLETQEHITGTPKRSDLVRAVQEGLIPEGFIRSGVRPADYLNVYVPTMSNINALTDPDMVQLAPTAANSLAPQLRVPSYSAYLSRQISAYNESLESDEPTIDHVGRAVLQTLYVANQPVGARLDQIAGSAQRLSRDPSVRKTPQSESVICRVVSVLANALVVAHGEEDAKRMLQERELSRYIRSKIRR